MAWTAAAQAAEGVWSATAEFAQETWSDTGSILTAPGDWSTGEWGAFALSATAIGVTMATVDVDTRSEAQENRSPRADRMAKLANTLGTGFSLGVLGVSAGVGWLGDAERPQQLARDGLEASIIASVFIAQPLKWMVGRARPNQDSDGGDDFTPFSGNASFPSGHTTQAFAIAAVVANTYRDHWWVGASAFAVAGTVGYARINDNQHYLSDVFAGALIGGFVGWSVVDLNRERRIATGVTAQITTSFLPDGQAVGINLRF